MLRYRNKNKRSRTKQISNVTASDTGDRKEVSSLDTITSFLVAVMAGVVCHYIIKWLDGDK